LKTLCKQRILLCHNVALCHNIEQRKEDKIRLIREDQRKRLKESHISIVFKAFLSRVRDHVVLQ